MSLPRRVDGREQQIALQQQQSFLPLRGGFQDHFVMPPEPKYCCEYCRMVLCNPRQTECGHRFCESCIPQLLRLGHFFFFNLQSLLHVFITITLSGYYHEGRKNVLRLVIHFLISNKTIKNLMLLLVCWIKDACLLNKNRLNLKLAYQHFKTYYSEHWWGIIILMFEKPFKLQRTQRGASNWWPNSVFIVAPGQSRAFVCSCKHKFGQIVP